MKAIDILQVGQKVLAGRAKEYDPNAKEERNMARIVCVFNAFHDTNLTEAQGWHFMQILKDVRLFGAPTFHEDSAIDACNYAALKGESLSASLRGPSTPVVEPSTEVAPFALSNGDLIHIRPNGDIEACMTLPLGGTIEDIPKIEGWPTPMFGTICKIYPHLAQRVLAICQPKNF